MNIARTLLDRHPGEATALIAGDEPICYAQLAARAGEMERALRRVSSPMGRRARVGLACPNGPDYIALALGILLADACLVPLAGELTAAERAEITRTTALDLIVQHQPQGFSIIRTHASAPPPFPEEGFQALNPVFIRFSSGTTGSSKGVVLSHESLLARITAANRGLNLGPRDRVLWMLPMAHHFAVSIILYLWSGAVTVLASSPDPADILATAERQGATVVYGSPFHIALLAAAPGSFRWPQLRLPIATAAPLKESVAHAFQNRFGQPVVQGLGIIECGLPIMNFSAPAEKPTAIGKPLPDYEVRLLDDAGHPVPNGLPGELCLRGPGFLDAYLSPWEPHPLDADGFFSSGDLAVRDAQGDLTLVGRRKSVINVSGMKVFPEEIEARLEEHPGVKRSLVCGDPHPEFGQIPVASLLAAQPLAPPTRAELIRHCRATLSPHKVPQRFTWVETLPLTASGKLKRG